MCKEFKHFLECESGSTAIEYGLIGAMVIVVIIGAMTGVGEALTAIFTGNQGSIGSALDGAVNG